MSSQIPQQRQRIENMERGDSIPLRNSEEFIKSIFNKYDTDGDGRISIRELQAMIRSPEYDKDIPVRTVDLIMRLADSDGSGCLDFNEFHDMIHHPQLQSVFGHLAHKYARTICAPKAGDVTDGAYEEAYSCFPPPLSMIIISIVELILFCIDLSQGTGSTTKGPVSTYLIYNPYRRFEAWRYVTYMLVHAGYLHIIVNLLVQIFLGVALEMIHGWWRVVLIYLSGVLAGSLGTSITDPRVFLAGASGGVYALIAAHIATIIMNWSQMEFALLQLLVFLTLVGVDVGNTIYTTYILKEVTNIGYMAHLAGAIAGLLVGIGILRNLEVKPWENKLWWGAMIVYFILMLTAILWNIFYTSHFPGRI